MDKSRLRRIEPGSFKNRTEKARGLAALLDDGYVEVDRVELVGRRMILVAWHLRPAITAGYEQARIWALVETDETAEGDRKVKFRDAGRGNYQVAGIPETLRDLQDNGTQGDVMVMLRMETYSFEDRETGEMKDGARFWFDDAEGKPLPTGDDEPDF
jgi:hypothetical protein